MSFRFTKMVFSNYHKFKKKNGLIIWLALVALSLLLKCIVAPTPIGQQPANLASSATIFAQSGTLQDTALLIDDDYTTTCVWSDMQAGALLTFQWYVPLNIGSIVFVLNLTGQAPLRQEIYVYAGPTQDKATATRCKGTYSASDIVTNQGAVNCVASSVSVVMIEFLDSQEFGSISFTDIYIYESPDFAQLAEDNGQPIQPSKFYLGPVEMSWDSKTFAFRFGVQFFVDAELNIQLPFAISAANMMIYHAANDDQDITTFYINAQNGVEYALATQLYQLSGNNVHHSYSTLPGTVFTIKGTLDNILLFNYQSVVILANDECYKAFGNQLTTQSDLISYQVSSDYGMTYQISGELSQVFDHCGYTSRVSETVYEKQGSSIRQPVSIPDLLTVNSIGILTINVNDLNKEADVDYTRKRYFDILVDDGADTTLEFELIINFIVSQSPPTPATPDCSTAALLQYSIANLSIVYNSSALVDLSFPEDSVSPIENKMLCGERTFSFVPKTSLLFVPVEVTGTGPNYKLSVSSVDVQNTGPIEFDVDVCLSAPNQQICTQTTFEIYFTNDPSTTPVVQDPDPVVLPSCSNTAFDMTPLESIHLDLVFGSDTLSNNWVFAEAADSFGESMKDTYLCGQRVYTFMDHDDLLLIRNSGEGMFKIVLTNHYPQLVEENTTLEATVKVTLEEYPLITAEFIVIINFLPCEMPVQSVNQNKDTTRLTYDVNSQTVLEQLFLIEKLPSCLVIKKSYIVRADDLTNEPVDYQTANLSTKTLQVHPSQKDSIQLLSKTLTYLWMIDTANSRTIELLSFEIEFTALERDDLPYFDPPLPLFVQINLQTEPQYWSFTLPEAQSREESSIVTVSVDQSMIGQLKMRYFGSEQKLEIEDLSNPKIPSGLFSIPILLKDENNIGFNLLSVEIIDRISTELEEETQDEENPDQKADVSNSAIQSQIDPESMKQKIEEWRQTYISIERELLQNMTLFEMEPPRPRISFIHQTGEIEISFSQKMKVLPDLNMATEGKIEVNGTIYPVLELSLILSDFSEQKNLNFEWELSKMSQEQIRFRVIFEKARYVSAFSDPEILKITFRDPYLFVSQTGIPIALEKRNQTRILQAQNQTDENEIRPMREGDILTIERQIPPQIQLGGTEQTIQQLLSTTTESSKFIVASNFVLNIFITASLNLLWSMINTQQLIVMMPLFQIVMPSNVSIFFRNIMEIASFDFFDIDEYVHESFQIDPTEAVEVKFQLIGFESRYFIVNVGTIFVFYIIYLFTLTVVYPLVKVCNQKVRRCKTFKQKLRNKVMWSSLITLINESYVILIVCLLINCRFLSTESAGLAVMSYLCVVFVCGSVMLPLALMIHISCNFAKLSNDKVRRQFGQTYIDLDLREGRKSLLHPSFFLLRRFALAATVFNGSVALIWQIAQMVFQIIFQINILGARLLTDRQKERFEFFNESILMMVLYTMLCYSPWVSDVDVKSQIGYVTISIVTLHLVVNILNISVVSFLKVKLLVKRKLVLRWHKNNIEAKRADLLLGQQKSKERLRKQSVKLELHLNRHLTNQADEQPIKQMSINEFLGSQSLQKASNQRQVKVVSGPKNDKLQNIELGTKKADRSSSDKQMQYLKLAENTQIASKPTQVTRPITITQFDNSEVRIMSKQKNQNLDLEMRFKALEYETEQMLSKKRAKKIKRQDVAEFEEQQFVSELIAKVRKNQVDQRWQPKLQEKAIDLDFSMIETNQPRRIRVVPNSPESSFDNSQQEEQKEQPVDRLAILQSLLRECQQDKR